MAARYASANQLTCKLPTWIHPETVTAVSIWNSNTSATLDAHPEGHVSFLNIRGPYTACSRSISKMKNRSATCEHACCSVHRMYAECGPDCCRRSDLLCRTDKRASYRWVLGISRRCWVCSKSLRLQLPIHMRRLKCHITASITRINFVTCLQDSAMARRIMRNFATGF